MTDATQTQTQDKPSGTRPKFRAWLVQDTPEGEAHWTELSGLWPTKSGKAFKGNLRTPIAATEGRLVILPATFNPHSEEKTDETDPR